MKLLGRRATQRERRELHPEVDDHPSAFTTSDPHPKQQGVRYFPPPTCQCTAGHPREGCAIHDPVIDEGDWDA